jgi:ornithine carbamoyltransferase
MPEQNRDLIVKVQAARAPSHAMAADRRITDLAPYQVSTKLMGLAKPEAIFLHCLPARRGEEVTDSVIDGPQSAVWHDRRLNRQQKTSQPSS